MAKQNPLAIAVGVVIIGFALTRKSASTGPIMNVGDQFRQVSISTGSAGPWMLVTGRSVQNDDWTYNLQNTETGGEAFTTQRILLDVIAGNPDLTLEFIRA